MKTSLLTLALAASLASAWPYVGFPIDQQLPQVGRIGEQYSFTLNPLTFKSDEDSSSISYQAFDLPSWLHFDETSLNLSGLIGGDVDEGLINFTLQGTDSQGSLNQTGSIYVSKNPSPMINPSDSIISQLEALGPTDGYTGLVLQPNENFNIKFNMDSFQLPSGSDISQLIYYGKSGNRTSLPPWVSFDADTLTFSGQAPTINALNAPSQAFPLTLIATDYAGFTGVFQDFSIVVGGHSLILNSTDYVKQVNSSIGENFQLNLPLNDILLDGEPITPAHISSVEINPQPSWVSINDNQAIVGTVPEGQTENVNLNVTLFDTYGDALFMSFGIDVVHTIFKSQLSDIDAQRGQFLEFQLDSNDFNNLTSIDITPIYEDADWLRFYHANSTFLGQVPDDFDTLVVEIDASLGGLTDSQTFRVIGQGKISSSSSGQSSRSSFTSSRISRTASSEHGSSTATSKPASEDGTSTVTSTSTSEAGTTVRGNQNKSSNKKALAIGLGVGIPVGLILLVLILLGLFGIIPIFGRKRRQQNDDEESHPDDKRFPPSGGAAVGAAAAAGASTLGPSYGSETIANNSNLEKLESDGYTSSEDDKTFEDALMYQHPEQSTDALLNEPKGVYNSWRKRDSTTSLATVATNDLLTVNMVETHNARKSQLPFRESVINAERLRTLAEETNHELKSFNNNQNDFSKDENSEHSQSGIVESGSFGNHI